MRKKGFTLIELLAVIVILAIIALIATPAVLNIIEDSRKSAAEASARNIVSAAKTYYMSETMQGRTVGTIDLSTNILKYDGDQAEKGYVSFTDGKPESEMYIGGYCVAVSIDGKVTSEKMETDECEAEPIIPPVVYTKYNDGDPLYFNPTTGLKCNAEDAVSITETKSGCMKWYAFLDSESSSTVKMILDHNTTNIVNIGGDDEPKNLDIAFAQVASDTTGWVQVVNGNQVALTGRLISAIEVNEIAPTTTSGQYGDLGEWDVNNYRKFYKLCTGNYGVGTCKNDDKYDWLFDNVESCFSSGVCTVEQDGTYGYWTSSYADDGYVWSLSRRGNLTNDWYDSYAHQDSIGVRPVIEVSKSIFE